MTSTNAPAHAAEHNDLMQLVAKVTDQSELIACVILVTVGADGRPMIGSDLETPEAVLNVLAQVMDAHQYKAVVSKIDVLKGN